MSNERIGAKNIATWDERRNSSRVFPVSPQDVDNARNALHRLRITDPALVEWIEAGHPTLTEAQHVEQFGEPYRAARARKA